MFSDSLPTCSGQNLPREILMVQPDLPPPQFRAHNFCQTFGGCVDKSLHWNSPKQCNFFISFNYMKLIQRKPKHVLIDHDPEGVSNSHFVLRVFFSQLHIKFSKKTVKRRLSAEFNKALVFVTFWGIEWWVRNLPYAHHLVKSKETFLLDPTRQLRLCQSFKRLKIKILNVDRKLEFIIAGSPWMGF